MATKMDSLQARVREMERVALGRNDRTDSWMNTWAFQARRELRRRRGGRKMPATQSRGRPQPSG
jgi:hypothetical protein